MEIAMQVVKNMVDMRGAVARNVDVRLTGKVDVAIRKGEQVAVIGDNGSGKNLLVDMLLGRHPLREGSVAYDFSPSSSNAVYSNVSYISFRDIYGSSEANYCYQLRWNVHEQDGIPTVRDVLGVGEDAGYTALLCERLGVASLLDKLVVMVSSGELRKLQIVKALIKKPRLLVLDNPFIGLDAESRDMLHELLSSMVAQKMLQLLLVLPAECDIPSFVDSVIAVDKRTVSSKISRDEYLADYHRRKELLALSRQTAIIELQCRVSELPGCCPDEPDEVLCFNDVSVRYGERTILDSLSWRVCRGEVWALSGRNGSGKSTLLSLVCADNLQSYSCDISLFGRKRGSGESIWEIKRRIGYVSPEMHRAYLRNLPMSDIVASGLFDTVGLYRKPTQQQVDECRFWMELFGIEHLAGRSFITLSSGEQRLALLARAFVKDPMLLILDEPMHGLDENNRCRVKAIVEAFSRRKGKSVVIVSHYDEELPSTVTHRLRLGE